MNKTIISLGLAFFILSMFLVPVYSFAQSEDESWSGLVPCGTIKYEKGQKVVDGVDMEGMVANPCNFDYFMKMINKVINFVLFQLVMPIAAIMFAYAGGLLLFAGGETSKLTQAKKIFTNVAIGLVVSAGAWLIVHSVLSILGYDGSWIGL